MLLVFFYGVTNFKDALWLLKGLIWTTVFSCFITIVDTFDIPNLGIITVREDDGRVEGILASSQEFAAFVTFFLPLIIALWWTENGVKRRLAFIGIMLAFAALLTAGSRGAIVGLLAGSAYAAFYLRRWLSARVVLRTVAGGLVLAVTAFVALLVTDFGDVLVERMTWGWESGDTTTLTAGRSENWSNILGEMFEYPLTFITGFGWEAFFQTIGYHRATHSVYIDRLYNLGLIGLSLTLVLYFNSMAVARRALSSVAPDAAPFLMALVFGLAGFMISITFSDIEAATYTWGCTGVALRLAFAGSQPATSTTFAARPV
jgi:O-antigen ligase